MFYTWLDARLSIKNILKYENVLKAFKIGVFWYLDKVNPKAFRANKKIVMFLRKKICTKFVLRLYWLVPSETQMLI
jgi:hypothetical protein